MKIIALPDLHEKGTQHISSIGDVLAAVDLVLLVGDLTNDSDRVAQVVSSIQRYNSNILAVPGNWDNDHANDYLSQLGINLHGRHQILEDMAFLGVGGSLAPGSGRHYTEKEYDTILQQALDGVDPTMPKILVTHQPPTGVLRIKALGSQTIRTFIERTQPIVCFFGHVHMARGIESIGSTRLINPGPLYKGHYAYAEITGTQVGALEVRRLPDWIEQPDF